MAECVLEFLQLGCRSIVAGKLQQAIKFYEGRKKDYFAIIGCLEMKDDCNTVSNAQRSSPKRAFPLSISIVS